MIKDKNNKKYQELVEIFKTKDIYCVEKENTLSANGNRIIKYQLFYISDCKNPIIIAPCSFIDASSDYKFRKRDITERWFSSYYYLQGLWDWIYRELELTCDTREYQQRFFRL